jgi:hypothetical protein
MIIGTLFTLFVVPSIYVLVARTRVAEASTEPSEGEPSIDLAEDPATGSPALQPVSH